MSEINPALSMIPISAIIIFKNGIETLPDTLDTLRNFEEVLIYDNGPTPGLSALCAEFQNVRIEIGEFMGFGPTRNHAASLARHDWIFAIDADEYLDQDLQSTLKSLSLNQKNIAYQLRRNNYYLGRKLHFGSHASDKITRLYHKDYAKFNNSMVHEKVVALSQKLKIQAIPGCLVHNPISSLYESIQKMNLYTEIQVNTQYPPPASSLQATGHALWGFFRSYVLFLGMFDGWRGLACAVGEANGRFYKYMKRVAHHDLATINSKNDSGVRE